MQRQRVLFKYRLYRQFEADIWGIQYLTLQRNWKGRFILMLFSEKLFYQMSQGSRFVYRIDLNKPRRIPRKRNWKFLQLKRIKLFYWYFTHSQFRQFDRLGRRKEGFEGSNFVISLENRVSAFLYRLNFFHSVFEILLFLRKHLCIINKRSISLPNYFIKFGYIVTFPKNIHKLLRYRIFKRFAAGTIFSNIPRYMHFSYKLMFGIVALEASFKDVTYPKSLPDFFKGWGGSQKHLPDVGVDIFRGTDYI